MLLRAPACYDGVDRPIRKLMCEQTARAEARHRTEQLACLAAALGFLLPLRALALPGSISLCANDVVALGNETVAVRGIVGAHPSVVSDGASLVHRPASIACGRHAPLARAGDRDYGNVGRRGRSAR